MGKQRGKKTTSFELVFRVKKHYNLICASLGEGAALSEGLTTFCSQLFSSSFVEGDARLVVATLIPKLQRHALCQAASKCLCQVGGLCFWARNFKKRGSWGCQVQPGHACVCCWDGVCRELLGTWRNQWAVLISKVRFIFAATDSSKGSW